MAYDNLHGKTVSEAEKKGYHVGWDNKVKDSWGNDVKSGPGGNTHSAGYGGISQDQK